MNLQSFVEKKTMLLRCKLSLPLIFFFLFKNTTHFLLLSLLFTPLEGVRSNGKIIYICI